MHRSSYEADLSRGEQEIPVGFKVDVSGLTRIAEVFAGVVLAEMRRELKSLPVGRSAPGESPAKAMVKPREAAKYLGISERQLWQLQKSGGIPSVDIGLGSKNKSLRYNVKDLDAFISAKTNSCPNSQEGE